MTTWQSILRDLRAARHDGDGWICGDFWYSTYRPTFSQRISIDLRAKRGYVVESRVCSRHEHKSTIHEYRLVAEAPAKQLALRAS